MAFDDAGLRFKFSHWTVLKQRYISVLLLLKFVEFGEQRLLPSKALFDELCTNVLLCWHLIDASDNSVELPRGEVVEDPVHLVNEVLALLLGLLRL